MASVSLLLDRVGAAMFLAFEALACLASVAALVILAAAPLYAAYLPFEPRPWQWAAAFVAVCAIAVAASWTKAILDRRLPASIGGDPRHAHISGWTFIWIVAATSAIVAIATWAAGSDQNRQAIKTEWGEAVMLGLVVAFVGAALVPTMNLADRAAGFISGVGRAISPFGRMLSVLDSILVFAVAGAAGVTQGSLLVRYAALLGTLGACAFMGYWVPPPWGLAPLAWGFLVAVAISRRWAWIETDRELAMLNRRFVGPHLRIGFGQDLRDEALLSFASLLVLVPLALRQAQISALDAHFELFNADLERAESLRTWIGFFGSELAKAVPFVDWAEVYDVSAAEDSLVQSRISQHFVFATRILVDFVFLAALLQALSISARNAAQRGLFYEGQLDRLDPFLEPHEFRKLLRRGASGRMEPDGELVAAFPAYDPIRLGELAGEDHDRLLRRAVNAVRARQGGDLSATYRELAERARVAQPDKTAILEVIHAVRAAGPERDVVLLDELRRELVDTPRQIEVRVEIARMIAEAPDSQEKADALSSMLLQARDSLAPIRVLALSELGAAARRGDGAALAALQRLAQSESLSSAQIRNVRALINAAAAAAARREAGPPEPPVDAVAAAARRLARADRAHRRRREDALAWSALAGFTIVASAAIFVWQNPDLWRGLTFDGTEWRRPAIVAAASDEVRAAAPSATPSRRTFQDCESCPVMVVAPGGRFQMGARYDDADAQPWETPQHEVAVESFAIGRHEVTFAQWDACAAAGACDRYAPPDRGWGRGRRPVMMVSWRDAQRYVRWLSETTGRRYRLPSEAEWEYAARAGASGVYWWGDEFDPRRTSRGAPAEVGSTGPNGFGLHDVTGNVAEWVEDCYVNNYRSAPSDARSVLRGDCARRVLRGGSWRDGPRALRIASRSRVGQTVRDAAIGFRVATSEVDSDVGRR
jgi:formylglycine-generating enzyme required for sulfatase activity